MALFQKGLTPKNKGKGHQYLWLKAHTSFTGADCLIWPFSTDKNVGRGRVGYNGKIYWAHRLMCELAHGPAPTTKHQAAHECGRGHAGCVNPRHLRWKTVVENMLDCRKHGTSTRNIHGQAGRLTKEQAREIRVLLAQGVPQLEIAAKYGISQPTVWDIKIGRTHKEAA